MKINPYIKNLSVYSKNFTFQNKETTNFKNFLLQKLKEIDASEKAALQAIENLAKGEDVDLSEVALRIAKADVNFKLLLRIRNKLLEAYQEIMRMQI